MRYIKSFADKSADFTQVVNLGGAQFTIRLCWNSRSEHWHMTIVDSQGGRIDGVKVVERWPLCTPHRSQIKMGGDLVAIPAVTDPTIRLGYDNLGTEWLLAYLTADELLTWKADNGVG